jgi:predicted metal-dependent phosphoesterase TrpH
MKLSDLSPPKEIATPKWKFKLQEFWRCSTHHDRLNMQVMLRMADRVGATKLLESWTPPQPATETKQSVKTPKRKFQYGSYGGWFYPGYHNNSGTDKSSDGADSNLGIQESQDIDSILDDFTKQCCALLGIETVPKIRLRKDSDWSQRNGSFGRFNYDDGVIELALANRHPVDVMRTLAHELVHHRQGEVDENLPADAGKTGSRYENEANAVAGQIMRSVAKHYPEVFGKEAIDEGWREKAGALATAACIAGSPGCATTADTVRGVQDVGRTVQTFKGYGTAGAKEELTQRLKNELRRRQGQLPEDIADKDYDATDNVNEAFDQPYHPIRWEKSDHGDADAIVKLKDGSNLIVMFNQQQGDQGEKTVQVEFYRNNSQEVTGEGDAQRVFATVLTAIQQYITKYKPLKLTFSASKETDPTVYYEPGEPQPNPESRAKLYDRLVQRYARAWGYRAFRADTGNLVVYELSRLTQNVKEATGYIPVNSKEAQDPRYSMAITQDIKPGEVQRQARKMGFKTTAAGLPPTLKASGKL